MVVFRNRRSLVATAASGQARKLEGQHGECFDFAKQGGDLGVPEGRFQGVFGLLAGLDTSCDSQAEHAANIEAFGNRLSVLESDADEPHALWKRHTFV